MTLSYDEVHRAVAAWRKAEQADIRVSAAELAAALDVLTHVWDSRRLDFTPGLCPDCGTDQLRARSYEGIDGHLVDYICANDHHGTPLAWVEHGNALRYAAYKEAGQQPKTTTEETS